eukprot:1129251-Rhodomonas_salina.1
MTTAATALKKVPGYRRAKHQPGYLGIVDTRQQRISLSKGALFNVTVSRLRERARNSFLGAYPGTGEETPNTYPGCPGTPWHSHAGYPGYHSRAGK